MTTDRDQAFIQRAQGIWGKVGDCDLTNWHTTPSQAYAVVVANGTPPRCRLSYNHAFIFIRKWASGQNVLHLTTICRAPWDKPLTWACTNGYVQQGKVFAYYSTGDYPLPDDFGYGKPNEQGD